jgi:rRNA biogenesis protein RRP5
LLWGDGSEVVAQADDDDEEESENEEEDANGATMLLPGLNTVSPCSLQCQSRNALSELPNGVKKRFNSRATLARHVTNWPALQRIRKTEQDNLDINDRAAQSAEDFERQVMSNPNSAFIWIQYIAYYLQLTEVDKAREVAVRALRSIAFEHVGPCPCVGLLLVSLRR